MHSPVFDSARGAWQVAVASPYVGAGALEVLLPTHGTRWPVLFVLPVEAAGEFYYGDGLALARALDLANRYGVIVAAPTFDTLPWYGSHVADPRIRHDAHLVHAVLPTLDACFPTTTARYLLGFSKSGFGAVSLLARFPDVFTAAASWDAPLLVDFRTFRSDFLLTGGLCPAPAFTQRGPRGR